MVNIKTFLEIKILVCDNETLHVSLNAGIFMGSLLHFDFDIRNNCKNYCTLLTQKKSKNDPEQKYFNPFSLFFFSYFITPENIREPIDFPMFSTRIKCESLEETFHRTNEKRKTKPIFKNNILYLQLRSQ